MGNFEVRDAEAEKVMRDIGNILKNAMPKGYGFTLFITQFGEKGNCFYMSSVERVSMIKSLEEFIERNKN